MGAGKADMAHFLDPGAQGQRHQYAHRLDLPDEGDELLARRAEDTLVLERIGRRRRRFRRTCSSALTPAGEEVVGGETLRVLFCLDLERRFEIGIEREYFLVVAKLQYLRRQILQYFLERQRDRCPRLIEVKDTAIFFRHGGLKRLRWNRYASAGELRFKQRERQRDSRVVRNLGQIAIQLESRQIF